MLAIVEREAKNDLKLSQTLSKFILQSLFASFFYSEERDVGSFVGSGDFAKLIGHICPIDNIPLQMEFLNTIVLRWYDWTKETKPSSKEKGVIKDVFNQLYEAKLIEDTTFADWNDAEPTDDVAGAKRASLLKTAMWFTEIDPANRIGAEDDEEYSSEDEQINNEYLGGDALLMKQENNNDYSNDDPNDFGILSY